MDHPTFADTAFISVLDKRLGERFPNASDVVGEEVPGVIAECFRAWWGDPMTSAAHNPLELRELAELLAITWGGAVLPGANSFGDAITGGNPGIGASAAASAGDLSSASSRRSISGRQTRITGSNGGAEEPSRT